MLILGLLGMYFDAAVVFVTSQALLLRLALAILCCITISLQRFNNFSEIKTSMSSMSSMSNKSCGHLVSCAKHLPPKSYRANQSLILILVFEAHSI
jgi:hypothetical protein